MEIISIQPETKTSIIGRLSDGSDREMVEQVSFLVTVKDDYKRMQLTFDHDPTEQEIADAINAGNYEDITTPGDMADRVLYLAGLVADLASLVLEVQQNG